MPHPALQESPREPGARGGGSLRAGVARETLEGGLEVGLHVGQERLQGK
jgi:hypothetical protein